MFFYNENIGIHSWVVLKVNEKGKVMMKKKLKSKLLA